MTIVSKCFYKSNRLTACTTELIRILYDVLDVITYTVLICVGGITRQMQCRSDRVRHLQYIYITGKTIVCITGIRVCHRKVLIESNCRRGDITLTGDRKRHVALCLIDLIRDLHIEDHSDAACQDDRITLELRNSGLLLVHDGSIDINRLIKITVIRHGFGNLYNLFIRTYGTKLVRVIAVIIGCII